MPEPTTPSGGETPPGSPPGEMPNTPGTGETPETTPTSIDAALKEIESLKAALKRTNNESKTHRLKADELDKLKAELEASKLSETEKWQKQASDLQSKYDSDTTALTERIMRYEVERLAGKLGIIDPDAAAQLIDWDALEYNEDGMPTNAESLLKDLLKNKPYLAGKQAATAGGATNPGRNAASAGGQISEQYVSDLLAGKLPQGTYEQLSSTQRAEVQRMLARRRTY